MCPSKTDLFGRYQYKVDGHSTHYCQIFPTIQNQFLFLWHPRGYGVLHALKSVSVSHTLRKKCSHIRVSTPSPPWRTAIMGGQAETSSKRRVMRPIRRQPQNFSDYTRNLQWTTNFVVAVLAVSVVPCCAMLCHVSFVDSNCRFEICICDTNPFA